MTTLPSYREFLEAKAVVAPMIGFDVGFRAFHPDLKDHQRAICRRAVAAGRYAIFSAFGLGKTWCQLEILRETLEHCAEDAIALVVLPYGVRQEFVAAAARLGIPVRFIRSAGEIDRAACRIYLTNYETVRDGRLDVRLFTAVSLDEASVLRSYGSKTYQTFLPQFEAVPYRFVATATPDPNRTKELIHYAGFLGVMDTGQALAQPLSAKVLTPTGWRQMGDLASGESVIAADGTPTRILGVYPQGEKQVFKVTFSDGAITRCTGDHLWLTRTQYQRNASTKFARRNPNASTAQYWTARSTDEVAATLSSPGTGSKNHEVPLAAPAEFNAQPVPVEPWLLGLLLGDGCLRETSVTLSSADAWIIDRAGEIVADQGLTVRKAMAERSDRGPCYDYVISGGRENRAGRGHFSNPLLHGLRQLGLLGMRAWEKRIPDLYKFNTPAIRLATLQGLMDADGTIARHAGNRTPRLTTTSKALADDTAFLARSLGGTAHVYIRSGRTPSGDVGRDRYVVTLRLPNGTNPFQLPRKAELVVERGKYVPRRFIVAVEPDGVEPAQCIAVEHPERLYVTDDLVVTHNTRFFQRDSERANNLTLYPHKEREFWLWVNTWAVFLQRPSDLGFSDEGYDLPALDVRYHEVATRLYDGSFERDGQGILIRDEGTDLVAAAREKRDTIGLRVAKVAEIVAADPDEHFVLWHDLEDERRAIDRAIPGVRSVFGAQDLELREGIVADFSEGRLARIGAKPVMLGSGTNLQHHCHREIFAGVTAKFNDFIQAVHRVHRFGQTRPVRIDIVHTDQERGTVQILKEKWNAHNEKAEIMSEIIRTFGLEQLNMADEMRRAIGVVRREAAGDGWRVANNDCVDETRTMADGSVDLIVTSIPFANHYEYTPSYNDFGHTENNDHFWRQMDFLTPELVRVLSPGRIAALHVKDRINFGNVTGFGRPSVQPFHAEAIFHGIRHGLVYCGMITIVTDVVFENNGTYRLSYSEMLKDSSKMGVGSPEYVLLFFKPQSDLSKGYSDVRVAKARDAYSLARWQIDAHAFWRSSGDRMLTAPELARYPTDVLARIFPKETLKGVYDYRDHVAVGEALEERQALPTKFMALAPGSEDPDVWHDVVRMRTLNGEQAARGREKHVCPLQFDIVDRLIERYSMKGETVFDPFGGLFTVPYCALALGRRGAAVELNGGYFDDGVRHLQRREAQLAVPTLFQLMDGMAALGEAAE